MELGVKDHGRDLGVPLNEGVDQAVHQPVEIALGVGEILAPAGVGVRGLNFNPNPHKK